MAIGINKSDVSSKDWGDVDKTALGNRLRAAYADGSASKAIVREVYAYVGPDAFSTDSDEAPLLVTGECWGPHHELVGESIILNRGGLSAAAAAAAGGRAEPSLSANALSSAKTHLRKHYTAIDEPPPDGIKEAAPPRTVEFTERAIIPDARLILEAAESGKPRRLTAWGLTADVVNANLRLYPADVIRAAVLEAQDHLHESFSQGRLGLITGEAEHPSDKNIFGFGRPNFLETVVKWDVVEYDETLSRVSIEGNMIPTAKGLDACTIMDAGVYPAISHRAYGKGKLVDMEIDGKWQEVEVVEHFTITGYDLLAMGEQSDPNSFARLFESRSRNMPPEATPGTEPEPGQEPVQAPPLVTVARLQADHPDVVEALVEGARREEQLQAEEARQLEEAKRATEEQLIQDREAEMRAKLGLKETDDLAAVMEERDTQLKALQAEKQAQAVTAYVEAQVAELKYPKWMKDQLLEAITAAAPGTVDEAKATITLRRREYDAIMAKLQQQMMGSGGLRAMGPVLEAETGYPTYAGVSYALMESMAQRGLAKQVDFRKPASPNEEWAARYLVRFDEQHRHHLKDEQKRFDEAEQVSDLNLPYSVARTVVAAALPILIASGVFDFGLMTNSPERLYFEAYAAETGRDVSITDENVTSDHDVWVNMAHQRLIPGTVNVEPDGGGTALTEGTDYVIDYVEGQMMVLSTGTMADSTIFDTDYDYRAIREGEMAAIERAKRTLSYETIEAVADRLAMQVSREAIVFSRAQLGYDAVARTLSGLVQEIAEIIDEGILYQALAAVLTVANNTGGTWTAATDPLSTLIEYIGYAKVLVANRFYAPTGIVMSVTNSDIVSNSDLFSAAGTRPDLSLNANGYVGRLKGLPVFETTQASDGYILVVNRELVMHRVHQPLIILGPFPTYDVSGSTSKLVAADQYYTEEYNATKTPVEEKGAYVVVA